MITQQQSQELSIGNFIFFEGMGTIPCEVDDRDLVHFREDKSFCDYTSFIPFVPEALLKSQIETEKITEVIINDNPVCYYKYSVGKVDIKSMKRIQYLHELQNFYFKQTGTVLPLRLGVKYDNEKSIQYFAREHLPVSSIFFGIANHFIDQIPNPNTINAEFYHIPFSINPSLEILQVVFKKRPVNDGKVIWEYHEIRKTGSVVPIKYCTNMNSSLSV